MELYIFKNDEGKLEEIELEKWAWLAIYKDGSTLKQFDDISMVFHRFKEIKDEELAVFVVYNTQSQTGGRYEIHIKEGMSPIFFQRVTVLKSKTPQEKRTKQPVFGYKETVAGQSIKTLMSIYPNGAISIRNHDT